MISSKIWTQLGIPQLDIETKTSQSLWWSSINASGNRDVEWNGSRLIKKQLAVVQSDKEFGLRGRDLLFKHGEKNITTKHLPAVKGYKAHMKLIPGSKPMFCKAKKIPQPLQDKVTEKLEQMVGQGIFEPEQPGVVNNGSPVVRQRKKRGEVRLCVDLKLHINGKVMDEYYQILNKKMIVHNLHWPHTLAILTSQMPTIKLNLTKRQKTNVQSTERSVQDVPTTSGMEELVFNLPE